MEDKGSDVVAQTVVATSRKLYANKYKASGSTEELKITATIPKSEYTLSDEGLPVVDKPATA